MTTEIVEQIKQRGYWHTLIRPMRYVEGRIPYPDLTKVISQYQVSHRGWYFPHVDVSSLERLEDSIQVEASLLAIRESWRLYTSGQFILYRGLTEDWLGESPSWNPPPAEPGQVLAVTTPLYHLSEAYEFASRLAQAELTGDEVGIQVNLKGTEGRILWSWPGEGRFLSRDYRCDASELSRGLRSFSAHDLVTSHAEYSYEHFEWMMARFGFEPGEPVFRRDQERFFQGRM